MKLWELFDEKYIGKRVKYKTLEGEERTARIKYTIIENIGVFSDDSDYAICFTQYEIQTYNFELINEEYTFKELSSLDLNESKLKLKYNDDIWIGDISCISESLLEYLSSQEYYDALTKGKWYIVD